MADGNATILHYLSHLVPAASAPSDAALLERFVAARDEAAFEILLRRHGPMVWGVCLRQLGDATDAEDAFQATFLVLARKAGAIGRQELLANWLYRVALRTARRAQSQRCRRLGHERQVPSMPEPPPPRDAGADLSLLLGAELARLSDKYRKPILLCYL